MDVFQFPKQKVTLKVTYTHGTSTTCMARIDNFDSPVCEMNGREFGAVDLSQCLASIVDASPDVLSSESTDYAVYSLDVVEQNAPYIGHGKLSTLRMDNSLKITGLITKTAVPFRPDLKSLDIQLKLVPIPGTSNYQKYQHNTSSNASTTTTTTNNKKTNNDQFVYPTHKRLADHHKNIAKNNHYLASSPIALGNLSTDEDQSFYDLDTNYTPASEIDDNENDENIVSEFLYSSPDMDQQKSHANARTQAPDSYSMPASLSAAETMAGRSSARASEHEIRSEPIKNDEAGSSSGGSGIDAISDNNSKAKTSRAKTKANTSYSSVSQKHKKASRGASQAKRSATTKENSSEDATTVNANNKRPNSPVRRSSEASESTTKRPNMGVACKNCGSTSTYVWRRVALFVDDLEPDVYTLCNPCGLYYSKHRKLRPHKLWSNEIRKRQKRKADGQSSPAPPPVGVSPHSQDADEGGRKTDAKTNITTTAAKSSTSKSDAQPKEMESSGQQSTTSKTTPSASTSASSPVPATAGSGANQPPSSSSSLRYQYDTAPSSPPPLSSKSYLSSSSPPPRCKSTPPKAAFKTNSFDDSNSSTKKKKRTLENDDKENVPPHPVTPAINSAAAAAVSHHHIGPTHATTTDSTATNVDEDGSVVGDYHDYREVEALFRTPKQRTPIKMLSENTLNCSPASNWLAKIMSSAGGSASKHTATHHDDDPLKGIFGSPSNKRVMDMMDLSSEATLAAHSDSAYFMYEDDDHEERKV